MFREIVHGFLEVIIKNISVETPHCRKTRANQRGRSEEKTYSNVPSRDVATIFKTRRNSVTAPSPPYRGEFYQLVATETKNMRFWPKNSRLCCLAMPIRWKIGLRRDHKKYLCGNIATGNTTLQKDTSQSEGTK